MNPHFSERLLDAPLYLLVTGLLEGALLGGAALVALAWVPTRGRAWYVRTVRRWATFAALLLVFGCIGNSVFMNLAYGRLYVSADTVVDFYPFIPFGQWMLDVTHGESRGRLLGGASLLQLQTIWFVVAGAVWAATLVTYFWAIRDRENATA